MASMGSHAGHGAVERHLSILRIVCWERENAQLAYTPKGYVMLRLSMKECHLAHRAFGRLRYWAMLKRHQTEQMLERGELTHVICYRTALVQKVYHLLPVGWIDPAWIVILLLWRYPRLVIRRPGIDSMHGQRDRLRLAIIHALCVGVGARGV